MGNLVTFLMLPEEQIEEVFQTQLDNLGVDYVDYYLLHNLGTVTYDSFDVAGAERVLIMSF